MTGARAPQADAAIAASGVHYRYGRDEVLGGVDLLVGQGEALLVCGRNGSGKSTLLRILAGIDRPSAGSVRVGGGDPAKSSGRPRPACGYVPDLPAFDAELSVEEALRFHARCGGLTGSEARDAADSMLQVVDLGHVRTRRPGELSRGQRQRLAIARALVHDPNVLVLDEPLAPLDPPGQVELSEVLFELKAMGRTVVVGTQAPAALAHWADTVAVLADGRLTSGPVESFRSLAPDERAYRLVVLGGAEAATALLGGCPAVRDLVQDAPVEDSARTQLRFALRLPEDGSDGDGEVAALVADMVRSGVAVVEICAEAPQLVGVE